MPHRTPRTQAEKHTRPELFGPEPETGELYPGTDEQIRAPVSDTEVYVPPTPYRNLRKV